MTNWIEMGLSNAVMATLLAIVAAGVSRWSRRPALAHALWVLVLIKLITPSLVSVPVWRSSHLTAGNVTNVDTMINTNRGRNRSTNGDDIPSRAERNQEDSPDSQPNASPPRFPNSARQMPARQMPARWWSASGDRTHRERIVGVVPVQTEEAADLTIPVAPNRNPPIGARHVIGLIVAVWIAGSLIYFARVAWRLARFQRLMKLAHDPQPTLQRFVDRLSSQIGLGRSPQVVLVPGTVSPMVFASGRMTVLIVPQELVGFLADERQLETLIAHELAHLRRGDHWIRRLELVVSGLYWWLPTVWFTRRGLREVEEEICDAWVVKTLPSANRSYAEALLNTVDFLNGAAPIAPPAGSTIGHFRFIKRRIVMIMKGSVSTRLAWSGRVMVLVFAAAFLPFSFGSATAALSDENDETNVSESTDDPPEFSFLNQRQDDDDDDERDRRRDRRRSRDDRDDDDDADDDEDSDDDEDREDADDVREEVLEELKREFAELNDEIAEALREAREELTDELRSAPPQIQKVVSQIDIDALIDEILEDAPDPIRTFVDELDVQAIVKEALRDADFDDADFDGVELGGLQKMIMKEVSGELKEAMGELKNEMMHVQDEVREAMKTAPPEIRAMLQEVDIEALLDEVLEGSLPVVRKLIDELEIEQIIEDGLDESDDRDDDEREARGGNRRDRDDIEARLERRLDQLMREAQEIRNELRELRGEGRGR